MAWRQDQSLQAMDFDEVQTTFVAQRALMIPGMKDSGCP